MLKREVSLSAHPKTYSVLELISLSRFMFPFHQGKAYIGSHCSAGEKQRWSPKQMVLAAARNVPREKAMATHSSTLAWKIPWTEELLGCNPGVAKSRTRLSNSTFHFHVLEKEMASHSCVLACRIPGTGEPGGLPSMGSHRVGHDWSDLAAVNITKWLTFNLFYK